MNPIVERRGGADAMRAVGYERSRWHDIYDGPRYWIGQQVNGDAVSEVRKGKKGGT